MLRLVSSESVTEGHPDKVADQISDAVLDAALGRDLGAVVTCETLVTTGLALVAGELSGCGGTDLNLDVAGVARRTLKRIGYTDDRYGINADTCSVLIAMDPPSVERDDGATCGHEGTIGHSEEAGPASTGQGVVYGYATNEHPTFLPQPIAYAHALSRRLAVARREAESPFGLQGTAMVTVEYEGQVAKRVVSVVISTQHEERATVDEIESAVAERVLGPVLDGVDGFDDCALVVNPLGQLAPGRPTADCGFTGRKVIVDTYGGVGRHGGGSFSGKDPARVDRCGAYACRWVAKNLVAAGAASRCEVHLSYASGQPAPMSMAVDTFGTEHVDPARILAVVREVFDLRPRSIVRDLDLRRPIYSGTAAYGHFGRAEPWCTWERLDRVGALTSALGLR